jgi:AraC family transcriptional regulator
MIAVRIVDRPAFLIAGKSVYISGPDNAQFGRFWQECQADGLMGQFERMTGFRPGAQTGGATLGVSRVEQDPNKRDFHYMIAVEAADGAADESGLESYTVPACRWAVFECHGPVPEAIVAAEIYAFSQWLPASGYTHAFAPEMEVYPPASEAQGSEPYTEFWLPIRLP